MRCNLLVLREEWKAECHYSGRGERRKVITKLIYLAWGKIWTGLFFGPFFRPLF